MDRSPAPVCVNFAYRIAFAMQMLDRNHMQAGVSAPAAPLRNHRVPSSHDRERRDDSGGPSRVGAIATRTTSAGAENQVASHLEFLARRDAPGDGGFYRLGVGPAAHCLPGAHDGGWLGIVGNDV